MTDLRFSPIPFSTLAPGGSEGRFRREELEHTSFRPTIVIGIGGTGLAVVRRLKKLLRQVFQEKELGIFQYLVIDTAAEEVPEGEERLGAGEFLHLGAFDAADLIRHLDENPYVARWWPGGPERPYRPSFSGTGANRVRAVGRLVGYQYMGSTIIPAIENRIDRAIEINAQHGTGAQSLKIYLVCSLAGGTGSGLVLDLAYVSRMLGLRRQPTAYITGVLVLDDAFLPKARTANTSAEFSGNTFAALREINHFSATRSFRESYDDIHNTEMLPEGFRPFDICYLLGLHNADGQALESFESLADMTAAEMFLEIASPLHGRTENVLDNVRANERSIAGQPAAFSSFALSSLVYPLAGIASWCALNAHPDFSARVLLAPRRAASDVTDDVTAFAQTAGVEEAQADMLIDRLNIDEKGESLLTPAVSHDQVGGVPDAQLLGALQRMEEAALAALGDVRQAVISRTPDIQKEYRATLATHAESMLRDPQRGPKYLAWFLIELAERLVAYRDEHMVAEQSMYRAEVDSQEAAWREARESLARALRIPRGMPWRGYRLTASRTAYAAAFNAYLAASHDLERRTQAILCFSAFVDQTRELARRASDLLNTWLKLCEITRERGATELTEARATETDYSLMRNIVGRDELQSTLQRHLPDMTEPELCDHLAARFWQFFAGRFPGWTLTGGIPDRSGEASPPVQAYYFLFDHYAQAIAGKTLLERLKEIYAGGWEHEIELRYLQTSPFWNYNLSRYGDQIRNNLQHEPRLVGYGESDVQGWSEVVSRIVGENADGVNNKNPHEMLFLKTSHGLPLFALRSVGQVMRNAYRYVRSLWEAGTPSNNPIPVHVSSGWEREMTDIDPRPTVAPNFPSDPAGQRSGASAALPAQPTSPASSAPSPSIATPAAAQARAMPGAAAASSNGNEPELNTPVDMA